MSVEHLRKRMTRREFLTTAAATLPLILYGCKEIPGQPDKRFVTAAQWLVDKDGNIITQNAEHINLGVQLTLQAMNKAGLKKIDLTASPYNGSHADTTFSPEGFPIVALQSVKVENGNIVPESENSRVTITNLPNGSVGIEFDIPLNDPSNTAVVQPPFPVGQQVVFRVDMHGVENQKYVDQLNVANGIIFTRQPNTQPIQTP